MSCLLFAFKTSHCAISFFSRDSRKIREIMADSTSTTADASLLVEMEKLLDKKLKPFESRVNSLQQKQEIFSSEVFSILCKIQKISDDLSDEQESAARRFKDEIYKVHDTLDDLSEVIKDAKSYSRDNLDNGDSIKDKVIKIHKHLKVREVLGSDGHEESFKEVIQRTLVPELQEIKNGQNAIIKLCCSGSAKAKAKKRAEFKPIGFASNDSDIEVDLDQNISSLTSDINNINDKINEIGHVSIEKIPDHSAKKLNGAPDIVEIHCQMLLSKMDGLENKLNDFGTSQVKVSFFEFILASQCADKIQFSLRIHKDFDKSIVVWHT